MRGIVLKIENDIAIVLNNNGEYESTRAKQGWKIGELVETSQKRMSFRSMMIIAACVVMIIAMSFAAFGFYNKQVALVGLDSSSSIEIGINRFGRVVNINSYGSQSEEALLKEYKNKEYLQALDGLMQELGAQSELDDDSYVLITIQAKNKSSEETILSNIREHCGENLRNAQSEYQSVDEDLVHNAHENSMSAGKYSKVLELQEYEEINVEDKLNDTLSDIKLNIDKHHGCVKTENRAQQGETLQEEAYNQDIEPDANNEPTSELKSEVESENNNEQGQNHRKRGHRCE